MPVDYAMWMWGWPNRFLARMTDVHTDMILRASSELDKAEGIDTGRQLASVPQSFSGLLWTNRIEVLGPALKLATPAH